MAHDITEIIHQLRMNEYRSPTVMNRAANAMERLRTAIELVVSTFEKDEAQGYRSKDRQFAIDVLRLALTNGAREEGK